MGERDEEAAGLDLVPLRTTDDLAAAELVRAALEAEGIPVFVQGAQHHATMGILAGHVPLRVLVPQSRLAEARELLDALEARGATIDDADAPEGLAEPT